MVGVVASGDFWAGIGTLAFSIFSGGVGMAWRLGRLEQKVADGRETLSEQKNDITAIERHLNRIEWDRSGRRNPSASELYRRQFEDFE